MTAVVTAQSVQASNNGKYRRVHGTPNGSGHVELELAP
jgi:hypothetical protein